MLKYIFSDFKGLSQDEGWADLVKILSASPFHKGISINTT